MTPISSKRIAVFPGTFDPFTLGHMSIVSRGLELLDEVVIAIGINDSKRTYFTVEQRLEMLSKFGNYNSTRKRHSEIYL